MQTSFVDLIEKKIYGKVVLVRADFNAPIIDGQVADDTRIRASLETIQTLVNNGAKVVILAHLNRPGGKVIESERLDPVCQKLEYLLGKPVLKINECIGDHVKATIENMEASDILLLENIRFYPEELNNDQLFSKTIASYADYFVQDAFGVVHRSHASTAGIPHFLPSYSGALLSKEIQVLGQLLDQPKRPFLAIVGGAKISTKLSVIKNLLHNVDNIILGGAMVYTLLKANGANVGKSLVEDDLLSEARDLMAVADSLGRTLYIPEDHCVVDDIDLPGTLTVVNSDCLENHHIGVDVGPKSRQAIAGLIESAETIFWNGPLGIFEKSHYAKGTRFVAEAVAGSSAFTIVGGGDSVSAVESFGLTDKIDHISTGGGASLEFICGKTLPGIEFML